MDRHGMDAAALGCSDSVGSTRLMGAAGAGCEQERRRARVTHVWAADRRGRAATRPGGQRWDAGGREQERGGGGISSDRWGPGRTVPGDAIQLGLNRNEIQSGSN
jgi:hypothetical protein